MALLGIVVGAISGLAVAQMQPGPTFAAVVSNPPFSIGKALDTHIAKFDGNYYAIQNTPDVSLNPNSTVTVRKIGYGQNSFVHVYKTPSGTYSSEGLTSPNVRYPGIFTQPLIIAGVPFGGIYGWSHLSGWVKIPLLGANSFGYLDGPTAPASQDGVCVKDTETGACR